MRGDRFFAAVAGRPPISRMEPAVAAFFRDYLAGEKAVRFGRRHVVNSHFPPYPSPAFDRLVEGFASLGDAANRRLFSVTVAVTNRCSFRCRHCYNAGRDPHDLSLAAYRKLAARLADLGAVSVTLSGGEPLLRDDLEEIVAAFARGPSVNLNTTGWGLTAARARRLRRAGLFGAGISLDSDREEEHDRQRGRRGAFRRALAALKAAGTGGLYPYVITVANRALLERERFFSLLAFARRAGALEVHLLEPCAVGRLAGRRDLLLKPRDRRRIVAYQRAVADRDDLPILSTFTYLESGDNFGCGAGLTHLYVDGSGEVGPCNLVPLSFGNIRRDPLDDILQEMGRCFRRPRTSCIGQVLSPFIAGDRFPLPPEESRRLCREHLPRRHEVPRFFRVREASTGSVGSRELREAYDGIHRHYDDFWVVRAGRPVRELVKRLGLGGGERVFEAGSGTGYATLLLAGAVAGGGRVTAVDLSRGMTAEARRRLAEAGVGNVTLNVGDALKALGKSAPVDLVFSSWVLGYIPLAPFFAAARRALAPGGRLAFVVHRENSPREPLEIFGELVAEDPSVLTRRAAFDFPRDGRQVREMLADAGYHGVDARRGTVVFRYRTAREVLDHLLKSGAGTAFYEAVDQRRRPALRREFLRRLAARHTAGRPIEVRHDYLSVVAARR